MRSDDIDLRLVHGDEQRGRVRTAGEGDEHPRSGGDKRRIEQRHGGAGWTRTSDNAIMSRALYHLSYGTPSIPAKSGAEISRGPLVSRAMRNPSARRWRAP